MIIFDAAKFKRRSFRRYGTCKIANLLCLYIIMLIVCALAAKIPFFSKLFFSVSGCFYVLYLGHVFVGKVVPDCRWL